MSAERFSLFGVFMPTQSDAEAREGSFGLVVATRRACGEFSGERTSQTTVIVLTSRRSSQGQSVDTSSHYLNE